MPLHEISSCLSLGIYLKSRSHGNAIISIVNISATPYDIINVIVNSQVIIMVQSSLPFEVLLYLNYYYFIVFVITECVLYFFKISHLPYSTDAIFIDGLVFMFHCSIQLCRIHAGRKGNLTGRNTYVIVSLLLIIPSLVGILYFTLIQLKVLRLEVILCYIEVFMEMFELIFGLFHLCATKRSKY